MSDAIHRDDLPYDVAEAIVNKIQELHPGYTVRFAGDEPADREEHERARELSRRLNQVWSAKLKDGVCMDCSEKYPSRWPPQEDDELADGWVVMSDVAGGDPTNDESDSVGILGPRVVGIVCPNCDSLDGAD